MRVAVGAVTVTVTVRVGAVRMVVAVSGLPAVRVIVSTAVRVVVSAAMVVVVPLSVRVAVPAPPDSTGERSLRVHTGRAQLAGAYPKRSSSSPLSGRRRMLSSLSGLGDRTPQNSPLRRPREHRSGSSAHVAPNAPVGECAAVERVEERARVVVQIGVPARLP
jgi:hypothetical protein